MKQLILHMGRHKTGSSSLQEAFASSERRLARAGVLYPRSARVGTGLPSHEVFAHWLRPRSPRRPSDRVVDDLVREINASSAHTVVIASEEMDVAFYIDDQYERLRRFIERLDPPVDVHVIAHFREQVSLLAAEYSQQARQFMQTRSFAEFCNTSIEAGWYDHHKMFERLIGSDDFRFTAVPYGQLGRDGLIETNLKAMGLTGPSYDGLDIPEMHVNVSLGPRSIEAYRVIALRLRPERVRYLSEPYVGMRRFLDARFDELGWNNERYWPYYEELVELVEGAYRESNDRFARATWGTEWPDPTPQRSPLFVDLEYMAPDEMIEVAELVRATQEMEQAAHRGSPPRAHFSDS